MNKYVLFSPIGTTDPIREYYDGPMLHIVRHYSPQKVYLYYTKEMARKREIIKQALKPFNVNIEEIITDIQNPHDFDIFSKTFDEILLDIQKNNPDSQILLNISSGTPQIKSALCLEVVSSHLKLKPIQVLTPIKGSNENVPHGGEIGENLDDLKENDKYMASNRCIEANILSFKRTSLKRDIISLVSHFEYRAALEKLEENKELFDAGVIELVRYAMLRQNDNEKYKNLKSHKEFNYIKNIKDNRAIDASRACDYYCILSNKAKIGELSYFILLLKPLAEYIARHYLGYINHREAEKVLDKYYLENTGYGYKPQYIYVEIKKGYREKIITYNLEQYICLMEDKKMSKEEILKFKEIQKYMERRNVLAHELSRIDNINTDKILKYLRELILKTFGSKVKEINLYLYKKINEKIIQSL